MSVSTYTFPNIVVRGGLGRDKGIVIKGGFRDIVGEGDRGEIVFD